MKSLAAVIFFLKEKRKKFLMKGGILKKIHTNNLASPISDGSLNVSYSRISDPCDEGRGFRSRSAMIAL